MSDRLILKANLYALRYTQETTDLETKHIIKNKNKKTHKKQQNKKFSSLQVYGCIHYLLICHLSRFDLVNTSFVCFFFSFFSQFIFLYLLPFLSFSQCSKRFKHIRHRTYTPQRIKNTPIR